MITAPRIEEFKKEIRHYLGKQKTVYIIDGAGPCIVLMHEIPGLTPNVLRLAALLHNEGFRIVMPDFLELPVASRTRFTRPRKSYTYEFAQINPKGGSCDNAQGRLDGRQRNLQLLAHNKSSDPDI